MHLLWKLVEVGLLSVSASSEQWVLNKGVGWEEIEKDGLTWSRESKRKNGRMREITSPGSCINPDNRMSKVPGTFYRCFPNPRDNFLSLYENRFSCTVHSSGLFWKWVGGFQGSWVVLTLLTVHAQLSASFLHLHCAVLSPGNRTRAFVLEMCHPISIWPLLQPHPVLSHSSNPQPPSCQCFRQEH